MNIIEYYQADNTSLGLNVVADNNDNTHQHAYCGRDIVRIRVFVLTSVDGQAALGNKPYEHTYLEYNGFPFGTLCLMYWIYLMHFAQ